MSTEIEFETLDFRLNDIEALERNVALLKARQTARLVIKAAPLPGNTATVEFIAMDHDADGHEDYSVVVYYHEEIGYNACDLCDVLQIQHHMGTAGNITNWTHPLYRSILFGEVEVARA
jgi:hypothetical protein